MGSGSSKADVKTNPATMVGFDLKKFLGKWYEIGRSKGADGASRCNGAIAEYIQSPTGINVHNTCYNNGKRISEASGTLTTPDPQSPARLSITVKKNSYSYWILDTDYTTYAVVGNKKADVWILARTPQLGLCVYDAALSWTDAMLYPGLENRMVYNFRTIVDCGRNTAWHDLADKIRARIKK
jgi:apolipoprotein D and lipocalin family protein